MNSEEARAFFIRRSVSQHVRDILNYAKDEGQLIDAALKMWKRVAQEGNLSSSTVRAVEERVKNPKYR